MGPINTIMAAVDFSEYSRATLKYAAFLAGSLKAALLVGNVINRRDVEAIRAVEDESLGLSAEKFVSGQQAGTGGRDLSPVKRNRLSGPEGGPDISDRGPLGGTVGDRPGTKG